MTTTTDPSPVVHVLSQEGQPYGSERRCCNHCGAMIWGASALLHVDNWTDWRENPNNCGAWGWGALVDRGEVRTTTTDPGPVVHVLSQEGQPCGSERRCCNHCGVMIWGASAPPHVDNWADWRENPNNCGARR